MSVRDLPPDLQLPLSSGSDWWYFLGGRPALDLANTLRERWNRQVETLCSPRDLAHWLAAAGVSERPPRTDSAILAEARALREAIDRSVAAAVTGGRFATADLALIDDHLVHAGRRPQLRAEAGVPVLGERPEADSARRALGMIALDAAQMLGDPAQRARLRICASESCSARFYDRSPGAGRTWCSMRRCGNVAKARRHRERAREAGR